MQITRLQKITLGISGLIALAIRTFITLAPHAFYASYRIELGQDPNLLNELRAPGAGLAVFGALILAGSFRTTMAPISIVIALTVYVAFPVGRFVGIGLDGMPSASVLGALAVEVVIAGLLLAAFKPTLKLSSDQERFVDLPGEQTVSRQIGGSGMPGPQEACVDTRVVSRWFLSH